MFEPIHPVGDARVLAALNVLGWPDDREMSAHVEPDGYHITPAGHYWEFVSEVLVAADLAAAPLPDDVQRTAGLLRAAATMYGDEDVLAAADILEQQSVEITRLRRILDSARHIGVEAAAEDKFDIAAAQTAVANPEPPIPHEQVMRELGLTTETATRTAESAVEPRTTPSEGDPTSGPAQTLPEADTLIWDWTKQPNLDDLTAILARHGVRLTQVDNGTDEYEIRISGDAEYERLSDEFHADLNERDCTIETLRADLDQQTKAAFDNQTEANRLTVDRCRLEAENARLRHLVEISTALANPANECPILVQVLATGTGSHDDSVCAWCADLRTKREDARGRLRKLTYNAIQAGRIFVPVGAREDVARAVVDALECDTDNRASEPDKPPLTDWEHEMLDQHPSDQRSTVIQTETKYNVRYRYPHNGRWYVVEDLTSSDRPDLDEWRAFGWDCEGMHVVRRTEVAYADGGRYTGAWLPPPPAAAERKDGR